jgi:4-methyl-5(b-hydroxyethyl)-thiazole monophosphate biosynthesis
MDIIKFCFKYSIPIAAICGAPEILAELGYLKGKKITCYPGHEAGIIGAEYVDEPVVIDGDLITSRSAGTSEAFAFAIAEFLCGKEKADEIREKMKCINHS